MDSARRRVHRWLVVPFAAAVVAMSAVAFAPSAQAQATSLRQAAGSMRVGAAVTPNLLNNPTYANLARTHFSSLTAENHMKWDTVQPSPGNFNFAPGREIIRFAQQNNQMVYGHTLVWHSQAPGWLQSLSGNQLRQAMQTHITTVMQEFNEIHTWDVVNEVISDNGGQLRQSFWLNGLGQGYIADAFRYANAARPGSTLCMNDYSIDGINTKSDAYYTLVQQLLNQGVPINCMGFQAHLIVGQVPGNMQQNLQRFANLGLDVWVTELDIRIPRPPSQQQFQQQAQDFARVFTICRQVQACKGVTVWGIHDGQSWVDSTFPEYDSPLLWDDNFNPKPAFNAVLQALGGSNPPPSSPPPSSPPPTTQPPPSNPPPGPGGACSVSYSTNDWGGAPGFTASVTITNTGSSTINNWTLSFSFPAGQQVTEGWSATWSQQGSTVTANAMSWNSTLAPGQSAQIGFNGSMTSIGNNPPPTSFTLNGSTCTVA